MTPEQKIVEAAVAWRKAQHKLYEAQDARDKAHREYFEGNRRKSDSMDYKLCLDADAACSPHAMLVDALNTKLTDLLDKYIGDKGNG